MIRSKAADRRPVPAPPNFDIAVSLALLVICLFFASLLSSMNGQSEAGTRGLNVSLYKVASQDFLWLGIAVILFLLCWVVSYRKEFSINLQFGRRAAWSLATLVFFVTWLGKTFIYHDYALSMDEFMMIWQSELIQEGYLVAPAPDDWWPYSHATRPGFLIVDDEYRFWSSGYRPGTALLHAAMAKIGLQNLMFPVLCAGSVLILWKLAHRELKDSNAAFWSVLILATAPQFLITGMTPYTMTAHLFASLLWVWLFTIDSPRSHVAAIVLGCYALGLHHVHVHSFLALPFLLHLLFVRRRLLLSLTYAVSYLAAIAFWIFWIDVAIWIQGLAPVAETNSYPIDGGLGYVNHALSVGLAQHSWADLLLWTTNLTRFVAWQNLALFPLLFVAMRSFRSMPLTLRLMGWSALLSLVPYIILMPSQGHGWGYRYLHQVLGHLAVLAGFGWLTLITNDWQQRRRFITSLMIASCVVAIPLRAIQTEAFVRPFAETSAELSKRPVDIVLVDSFDIWYGQDLVRNSPLILNDPVILALFRLSDQNLATLCAENSVSFDNASTLAGTGMVLRSRSAEEVEEDRKSNVKRLERAGCNR